MLRKAGTERAFTGEYTDTETTGVYRCKACQAKLFRVGHQVPLRLRLAVVLPAAHRHRRVHRGHARTGMKRTEVRCANCGSHLGHVFHDGYGTPTGDRYCINSVSLTLEPEDADRPTDGRQGERGDQLGRRRRREPV